MLPLERIEVKRRCFNLQKRNAFETPSFFKNNLQGAKCAKTILIAAENNLWKNLQQSFNNVFTCFHILLCYLSIPCCDGETCRLVRCSISIFQNNFTVWGLRSHTSPEVFSREGPWIRGRSKNWNCSFTMILDNILVISSHVYIIYYIILSLFFLLL